MGLWAESLSEMTAPKFDITPFLNQSEGQHYDRKSLFHGPEGRKRSRKRRVVRDEVAEYVAAFANADGGVLVLGIEDDDYEITGHRLPPDALQSLLNTPANRLKPAQEPGFIVTVDGKELIVFDVPASDVPVQVIGDGFPLRMGDRTVQSSESQINALKFDGLAASWESRRSPARLADLDGQLLEQARQGAGLSALTDEEYLLKRKLADRQGRSVVLRNAAELLFARNGPEHPNAGVRLFRVVGTERRTGAAYNVEERPRIEGNLHTVISEAVATIGGLLRRPSRLVGNRFREEPEYPDFAWQEALLNAVAHRDYGMEGTGTEVHLFDDRMEVSSPGPLVGSLTLEALLRLERVHHSRNPRIIRTLVDLGLAREQGEGIPRMFAEMADAFLPQPDIALTDRSITVTLRNTLTLNDADRDFVSRLGDLQFDRNEFRALLHAHRHGHVDNSSLRALSGLDTLRTSYALRALRDRGLLELHAHGANSYYTLTEAMALYNPTDHGDLTTDHGDLTTDHGDLTTDHGDLTTDHGDLTTDRGDLTADRGDLTADRGDLTADRGDLSLHIQEHIKGLGQRPRRDRMRPIVLQICSQGRWVTTADIARLSNISPNNLRAHHLSPMVASGLLERRYPENPTHPQQAYRAVAAPPAPELQERHLL